MKGLRKDPSPLSLSKVLQLPQIEELFQSLIKYKDGSDGEFTVAYLKVVNIMMYLVSAVRECNIEQHLQAEREMITLAFALDHQNYARYCSYQNVYLNRLKETMHPAFLGLQEKEWVQALQVDPFPPFTAIWSLNCSIKRRREHQDPFDPVSVQT